jgi:hypothetical protein
MSDAVSTTGILVKRKPATLPATVVITSSSISNPGRILTAAPHGLNTGDTVIIAGHTGMVPSTVNGTHIVTVTDADEFTIPIAITTGGTGGTMQREYQAIGEIVSVTPPGYSRNKIPTSTHNEGRESNVLGILMQRDPAFRINYVGGNLTHIDILNDIINNVKSAWNVTFPSGVKFAGDARVQQFNLGDAPVDAAQQADVVITWAGPAIMTVP